MKIKYNIIRVGFHFESNKSFNNIFGDKLFLIYKVYMSDYQVKLVTFLPEVCLKNL